MTGRVLARFLVCCATMAGIAAAGAPRARQQSAAVETRERAWRANNVGVAHLEQFDFEAASTSFREALDANSALAIARLNLGIARFYAGDLEGARTELTAARAALPERPQPDYVLGLVARAENRTADALAAFERVRSMDPTDVGTAINLGQLYLQERRYDDAVARFRDAIAAEPYNATAAYGLATALTRSKAEGAEAATERFQTLRTSEYAVTYSQNYLEQGRYAEAVASSGAEASLVDTRVPAVSFTNNSDGLPSLPTGPPGSQTPAGRASLADVDDDGDLDILDAGPDGVRLLQNDGGRFTESAALGRAAHGAATAALAADYDNDGATDVLILRPGGPTLLRRTGPGAFEDATAASGLSAAGGATAAAWVDVDHDGDLDLVLSAMPQTGAVRLLRNNGDGRFEDVTAAARLASQAAVSAIVPTDYDNRRDVDLLLVGAGGDAALYSNRRDGTFADVAGETGLTVPSAAMASAGDINKDGFTDLVFARPGNSTRIALSDGRGRFAVSDGPGDALDARAAQLVDYDGDGLLDLVALTGQGARLLRNLGDRWSDVTATALPGPLAAAPTRVESLAAGDVDGDGDTDLLVRADSTLRLWRNEGGSRHAALAVGLRGRASNRSGVGTKVEMRAGSLRQRMETYAATPAPAPADIVFGLGDRQHADAVRLLWPSGILQAETAIPETQQPLKGRISVEELDRKPSSCPYLYTWNGSRFVFITDFLGGGEMGYWLGPGARNQPIPTEYVRIPPGALVPRDGRLELRVTNELEEALFLDRLQLLAVDHPVDTSVYPNAGLREGPEPFVLYRTRAHQPLVAATDSHGHDVLDRLAEVDRIFVDDFALESIRGYAETHALTLTLPPSSGQRLLLLNGWTDYAFSRDNVAAHQQDRSLVPPSLEVADGRGGWRTLIDDIGFPAGRPQTVTLDLTGKLPAGTVQVRIVTNMRIYWDQIVATESDPGTGVTLTPLDPAVAELRWRGFSAEVSPDGREPWGYDYDRITPDSPWKLLPGRYTREGDVLPLLGQADDMFVVSRPGDEIVLSFDAAALPQLPDGWSRTYLLYADGYSKEMDLHSSSPDALAPLPFHGMSAYPYPAGETYPASTEHADYLEKYNTRIVARPLPPLELVQRRAQRDNGGK